MAGAARRGSAVLDIAREQLRVTARVMLPVAIALALGAALILLLLVLYGRLAASSLMPAVTPLATTPDAVAAITVGLMAPVVLLAILAALVWAGIVVERAGAVLTRRRVALGGSAWRAFRRAPRAGLVTLLALLAVLLAIALTPLLVVGGLLGLALTPLARRSRLAERWPRIRSLVIAAVPFAAALLLLARVALAAPSVWLAGSKLRAAFRDASARARGREVPILLVILVSALVTAGVGWGFSALAGALGLGDTGATGAQLLTLAVVGPLLLVGLVVQYHRADGIPALPRAPRRLWRSRTAIATATAMVVPFLVVGAPAPAMADDLRPVTLSIRVEPSPVVAGATSTIIVTIPAEAPDGSQPTGDVQISVDGNPVSGSLTLSGSPRSVSVPFTFTGSHVVVATYGGDTVFAGDTQSLTVTAGAPSTVSLTPPTSSVVYGASTPLTATVSSGATGTVTFVAAPGTFSETELGVRPLAGGPVVFDAAGLLPPGTHSVVARYSGDSGTLASESAAVTVTVTSAATTTSLTISPTSPSAATATLTAHVEVTSTESPAAPSGTIDIYADGGGTSLGTATLVDGEIDVPFTLPPGLHSVVAYFTPDAGFQSSSIDESHRVSPFASGIAVTTSPSSSVFGQPVTITATLTAGGAATGDVTFEARPAAGPAIDLGAGSISGNVATVTTSALPVGSYDLVATYDGSTAVDDAVSPAVSFTVGKAAVAVDVVPSTTSPVFGGTVRLTITVSAAAPGAGDPTGTVVVKRDGVTLGTGPLIAGTRQVDVSVGGAGTRGFTVEYSGDDAFDSGTGTLDLTVAKATTSTVLTTGDLDADYGDPLVWAGSVSSPAGTPTGTVELYVGGGKVAEGTLTGGGFSITTDDIPVGTSAVRDAWVVYVGDADHLGSDTTGDLVQLTLAKAEVDPDFTVTPAVPAIGETATLRLDLGDTGRGPTGTVTFSTLTETFAPVAVVDGVAEFELDIEELTTYVDASYSGDANFEPWATTTRWRIDADGEAATVTLAASAPFTYGTLVDLVSTVTLGGGSPPDHGVEFLAGTTVLDSDVEIVGGVARLSVCVGQGICPSGVPRLGTVATTLTARYAAGSENREGVSPGLAYEPVTAPTTTALTLTTASTVPGGAVTMTAEVAASDPNAIAGVFPAGSVRFGMRDPDGSVVDFVPDVPLVDGEASLTTIVGSATGEIRWPAEAIVATYLPLGTSYATSTTSKPFAITRIEVTRILVSAAPPTAFQRTRITVSLTHAGGSSAPFTGTATVTSDTGETCIVHFPAETWCELTWDTAGTHTFSATYSGDVIYGPAGPSDDVDVTVDRATPTLGLSVPATAVVGADVAATWSVFDATSTGTVSVWGDGEPWCTAVPLTDGQCHGDFEPGSATGSPVQVRLQYTGDATWMPVEETRNVSVTGCATLDVLPTSSGGTVSIDTPSNCGSGGYQVGTTVTISAHAIAPNVFTDWKAYGATDLEVFSLSATTTFVVGVDSTSWVRRASFAVPCFPVTADATGSGGIVVVPASNCTTPSGAAGWLIGTAIDVYPRAAYNPAYGEPDVFASFGTLAGALVGPDRFGDTRLAVTVTRALSIPVIFGPNCRTPEVVFDPASPGDAFLIETAPNCSSPAGDGYYPGTTVKLTASSGDPGLAVARWSVDGVARPDLGAGREVEFQVGTPDTVVTAHLVRCVTLTVTIDGAQDWRGNPIGQVVANPEPTCPDGSPRYLAGSKVVLTPEVLIADSTFRGWDGDSLNYPAPGGTGLVPAAARTVTLGTTDLTVVAGFFASKYCSTFTVLGDRTLFAIDDNGCGPGYYYDVQKAQAERQGVPQWMLWQRQYRSQLRATMTTDPALDVYVSVRGDVSECFGGRSAFGPDLDRTDWNSYGPVSPRGTSTCEIGGPITVKVEQCQTLTSTPRFHYAGDVSGAVFGVGDLPETILAPAPDGTIGTYVLGDVDWVRGVPVGFVGGQPVLESLGAGPCADAGNAFPADTPLALFATSPVDGLRFAGYGDAPMDQQLMNPILAKTSGTSATLDINVDYLLDCSKLGLGEGVTVLEGAYCPGTDHADLMFVTGSAVRVQAAFRLPDGRFTESWRSGLVGGQMGKDDAGNLVGLVHMDTDKSVIADYPTEAQRVGRGIAQGLKMATGLVAIAAPIVLGWFVPPIGIALAVLGTAAGISNLIPGGKDMGSFFELIDPTNITECIARWGFDNPGDPTGGPNPGSMVATAKNAWSYYRYADMWEPAGAPGIAGGAASFALGVYTATGGGKVDFTPQTLEELADASTLTGCLDQQWKAAGSNVSG